MMLEKDRLVVRQRDVSMWLSRQKATLKNQIIVHEAMIVCSSFIFINEVEHILPEWYEHRRRTAQRSRCFLGLFAAWQYITVETQTPF